MREIEDLLKEAELRIKDAGESSAPEVVKAHSTASIAGSLLVIARCLAYPEERDAGTIERELLEKLKKENM